MYKHILFATDLTDETEYLIEKSAPCVVMPALRSA